MLEKAERALLERAVDLFNRKLYFECHDLLEEAWSGSRGEERAFLQGLLHAAVGMYHLAASNYRGATSQFGKALNRLAPFRAGRDGLDVETLIRSLTHCKARMDESSGLLEWRPEEIPRLRFQEARPK